MSPIPTSFAEYADLERFWRLHMDTHINGAVHRMLSRHIDMCFDAVLAPPEPITDDMRQMVEDLSAAGAIPRRRTVEDLTFAWARS